MQTYVIGSDFAGGFLTNSHKFSAQINMDLGRKLMRIAQKNPSELVSCSAYLQGLRPALAQGPERSWPEPYKKAVYKSGAHEANTSCYSAPWGPCHGTGESRLPCP